MSLWSRAPHFIRVNGNKESEREREGVERFHHHQVGPTTNLILCEGNKKSAQLVFMRQMSFIDYYINVKINKEKRYDAVKINKMDC